MPVIDVTCPYCRATCIVDAKATNGIRLPQGRTGGCEFCDLLPSASDLIDCPKCGANDWNDPWAEFSEAIECRKCGHVEFA